MNIPRTGERCKHGITLEHCATCRPRNNSAVPPLVTTGSDPQSPAAAPTLTAKRGRRPKDLSAHLATMAELVAAGESVSAAAIEATREHGSLVSLHRLREVFREQRKEPVPRTLPAPPSASPAPSVQQAPALAAPPVVDDPFDDLRRRLAVEMAEEVAANGSPILDIEEVARAIVALKRRYDDAKGEVELIFRLRAEQILARYVIGMPSGAARGRPDLLPPQP